MGERPRHLRDQPLRLHLAEWRRRGQRQWHVPGLKDKLAYLEDLGINGVWLAGYCNYTAHFCNIKSVYACLRPDEFDPALGTGHDFKAMIDEAHRRGIKVFLDAITHGVVNDSLLIAERPGWFKDGTWGMTDYDYENEEFRKW